MTARLRFELLGPVRAFRGDTELDLGSPQQRAMLAVLLLNEGRQVSVDEATSALWGEELPRSGGTTVRTYIYRLRRSLVATRQGPDSDQVRIVSDGGGYRLVVDPETVDSTLFRRLLADARKTRADGDLTKAAEHLHDALALWHGTPLAGVAGSFFDSQRTWLEQLRSTASEERLALDIELGNHAEAVASLTVSVTEEPYRERLWELLMLALYRCGRQADALAAYQRVARLLDQELGLEPGPGLRELHARILAGDPALTVAEEPHPTSQPTVLVETPKPAQLPPDVGDFVGRNTEITQLTEHLLRTDGHCVVELTGSVGMGKTTLAIHAAHAVRSHFPDGQLYADLHTRAGKPIDPAEVLIGFLRALGVPDSRLQGSLSELTALWRTLSAERRMLIVLDDVANSEQVWPLLPSSAGCAVVLTTARSLVALPVTWTAKLGALTPEDGLELFATIAGQGRVLAEPMATRRVLERCSYQPLAIRTAAHWLMNRPTRTVRQLESHIDGELRQPLSLSEEYQAIEMRYLRALGRLSPELASICQLVSVPELRHLDGHSAAALLGLPVAHATRALEALVGANFLEADADGSYHFHGFVRRMIRRQALRDKGPARHRARLGRLVHTCSPVLPMPQLVAPDRDARREELLEASGQ